MNMNWKTLLLKGAFMASTVSLTALYSCNGGANTENDANTADTVTIGGDETGTGMGTGTDMEADTGTGSAMDTMGTGTTDGMETGTDGTGTGTGTGTDGTGTGSGS